MWLAAHACRSHVWLVFLSRHRLRNERRFTGPSWNGGSDFPRAPQLSPGVPLPRRLICCFLRPILSSLQARLAGSGIRQASTAAASKIAKPVPLSTLDLPGYKSLQETYAEMDKNIKVSVIDWLA